MIRRFILACCLLNINSSQLLAQPLTEQSLMASGHALANYDICAQIALELGDNAMHSYYSEMFSDTSIQVNTYPSAQSIIVFQEAKSSMEKLAKLDRVSMGGFCLSRFDSLTRKIQEKKLLAKKIPLTE